MFYILSIFSYIVYIFLIIKIFVTSLISSLAAGHFIVSFMKIVIAFFLFYEIIFEWIVNIYPQKNDLLKKRLCKSDFYIFLSVFLGTLCTYFMNHSLGFGPVIASSLIGLIASFLLPSMAVPIYCGSFAGMVSHLLVSENSAIIIIALFTGILYVIASETFKGYGGKLGATAYFATLLTSIFFDTYTSAMTGASIELKYDIFIVFTIGSLGAYFINERYKIGAVVSSSLFGLIFGLILPNIFANGTLLATALFCGSFIGMSTTKKLTTKGSFVIASIIASTLFLYTEPFFDGLGGKLGLIAFASSISTAGIYNFKNNIFQKLQDKNSELESSF